MTAKNQLGAIPALLPCPFCGGRAQIWKAHPEDPTRKAWIACMDRCAVLTKEFETTEEAVVVWNTRADLASHPDQQEPTYSRAEFDEAYELGKRDGYAKAVQHIDEQTGGDGEYCCVVGDSAHDRHCPDEAAMVARIIARLEARPVQPEAPGVATVEAVTPPIDAMCMTCRHDFGLPRGTNSYGNGISGMTDLEREGLRTTMRQIWQHDVLPAVRAALSSDLIRQEAAEERIPFDQKAQGARCSCRGTDEWCPCQNVPDRATIAADRAAKSTEASDGDT